MEIAFSQSGVTGWEDAGVQYQLGDFGGEEFHPVQPCFSLDRQISFYVGLEGSKQPQDFGANANLGGRFRVNFSAPIARDYGLGFQVGTALVASANAVQVFELLDASEDRTQSFTTVGLFQRLDNGFSWGIVYDFLFQDSFDNFDLGQWRLRMSQFVRPDFEVGLTVNLGDKGDEGFFNSTLVDIDPISSFSVFGRKYWESTVITTVWVGQSAGHTEDNAIVGRQSLRENNLMIGSEIFAPLNEWMAIYGEANLIAPVDTGGVDAFLGVEFSRSRIAYNPRRARFRNLLPVASSTSFVNDLRIR